jgi:molybdate transport system substrate-binding protein
MRITITIAFIIASFNFGQAQEEILIAAASDLKFALDSVVTVFNTDHNGKIKVTYGSSGKLCEQIMNGAPFHIYFSADIEYPEKLKAKKLTASEIYRYALGQIVLWSKKIDTQIGMNALLDPAIRKISVANPAHAPYGKRAIESLAFYKLHEKLEPKLVYGENISQAAQYISTGAADIGIIALSLALSPNMKKENGNYFRVPDDSHQPLVQGAVITDEGAGKPLATTFFEYVKTDRSIAILKYFGFTKPD